MKPYLVMPHFLQDNLTRSVSAAFWLGGARINSLKPNGKRQNGVQFPRYDMEWNGTGSIPLKNL